MKKSGNNTPAKSSVYSTLKEKNTPGNLINILDKLSSLSSHWFELIAMVCLVGIIISTLIDVVGAKIFSKPIAAGTEIVYFLQLIAIAGALAATKIDGKHIRLEFVDNLPKRLKSVFHFIADLLGLVLFILLAWKSMEYGQTLKINQEVTAGAKVPLHPFVFWLALSCIPLCLVLLKDMVKSAVEVMKR